MVYIALTSWLAWWGHEYSVIQLAAGNICCWLASDSKSLHALFSSMKISLAIFSFGVPICWNDDNDFNTHSKAISLQPTMTVGLRVEVQQHWEQCGTILEEVKVHKHCKARRHRSEKLWLHCQQQTVLVISSGRAICKDCEDRTFIYCIYTYTVQHGPASLYVLLTLSGCTARQALLYAFLTSDGVTSWCISHLFHFASSHTTVCIEHNRALMLCVLPSIQSRICRDRKNIILYRFINVSGVVTIQLNEYKLLYTQNFEIYVVVLTEH